MFTLLIVLLACWPVDTKYNILHIIIDDLRPELPPYDGSPISTGLGNTIQAPNIKTLSSGSVVFERAYCQYPLCTPSRTSFLTGRRPTSTGVMEHMKYFRDNHPDYVTLPQFFKSKGYVSLGTGKVFHPIGNEESLSFHKFDEIAKEQRQTYSKVGKPTMAVSNRQNHRELLPDEAIVGMAQDHLRAFNRGDYEQENFYLAVGFMKPHLPWVAPQRFFDLYDLNDIQLPTVNKEAPQDCPLATWPRSINPILKNYRNESAIPSSLADSPYYNISVPDNLAREYRQGYYACISFVDSLIGDLLTELESLNLMDNTAIIFQSDHGYNLGEHSAWGKETMFEVTNHVPLMFKVPGVPGKHVDDLVELVDVFPTIADLAGFQDAVPRCDDSDSATLCHEGKSLADLIRGEEETEDGEAAFFSHQHGIEGVGVLLGESVLTEEGRLTKWTVRSGEEEGKVYAEELYNHLNDPKETANVIENGHYSDLKELLNNLLNH